MRMTTAKNKHPMARVIIRPLLVQGMLASDGEHIYILVCNQQSDLEKARTIWHEVAHWLGVVDEDEAERIGCKLAEACPEILEIVQRAR